MTGAGGRPRIQQMADDLGISYKEAKALMAESRENVSPAVARVLKGFNREGADRIAQEDTKMILKRKAGGSMTKAEIAERKRKTRAEIEAEKKKEYMDTAPKQQVKLERRGDKKKVIMAKDGKYMSHGGGGETVRGMGRAYQGSTRSVKIR